MSQADCVFCKIVAGQIPSSKIFENEYVLAFLDVGPVSDGHMLVIPKAHCQRLDQAEPEAMAEIAKVLPVLAGGVQKATESDGYNLLCNNGGAAGQVVEHLHFHIIPRNSGDGLFSHWPASQYPDGKAAAIAEKIKQNINL
ncbi:MAG: HIT family protein [Planctomycetota bacterium]|jgi:histidine triad (HIT) family protein